MSQKAALIFLGLIFIAGWGLLGLTITTATPDQFLNQLLFFGSVFIALLSTLIILAYFLSFRLFSLKRYQGQLWRAVGQGLPFAAVLTLVLWLQSLRILTLPIGVMLLLILALLEFLMLPHRTS